MTSMESIANNFRNEKSLELFDKNEYELQLAEIQLLNEYIKDLKEPTWLPVIYNKQPTFYAVSNTGEIRNITTGLILKQKTNRDGYKMLNLGINGKKITTTVHKLVAEAFLIKPEEKLVVNHKNGKKNINWYKNLEWITYKENTQHAIANNLAGRNGTTNPNNKFDEDIIHQICKLLESGVTPTQINRDIPGTLNTAEGIKRGRLWRNVANQYNIPKPVSVVRSQELKDYITELIFAGYSNREIVQAAGLPDTEKEREYVGLFRRRLFKQPD